MSKVGNFSKQSLKKGASWKKKIPLPGPKGSQFKKIQS